MRLEYPNIIGDINIYMTCLRAICGDTAGKSMIDLGCCFAPNTPKLGFSKRTYVDMVDRVLDDKDEQQFFVKASISDILHVARTGHLHWDVAICSDVIEHLKIEDGHKMLVDLQFISDKQIIFTPLGELWMDISSNDPEAHKSAWYPEMLTGWASIVFPDYHKEWGVGSFFAWRCKDIEKDFERVKNLIQL